MKTTPIPVKFDRQGHSCNFYVGFGPTRTCHTSLAGDLSADCKRGLVHGLAARFRRRHHPAHHARWTQRVSSLASSTSLQHTLVNLPGWCWAEIQQFALVGSSSSLHSEACNALGASDGVIHSSISLEAVCLRATANKCGPPQSEILSHLLCLPCLLGRIL